MSRSTGQRPLSARHVPVAFPGKVQVHEVMLLGGVSFCFSHDSASILALSLGLATTQHAGLVTLWI